MAALRIPKGVGLWGKGESSSDLPRPQSLVRAGWQARDLDRIVAYLRNGHVLGAWCGLAKCRFSDCGQLLGSSDLTDGEWIWPQKLEHYLLEHAVCLPDSFVATMRLNNWQVPADGGSLDQDQIMDAGYGAFGDLSEWIAFGRSADGGRT